MFAAATVDLCVGADGPDPGLIEAAKALSHSLIKLSETFEPTVHWLPRPAARLATRASAHLKDLLLTKVVRRRLSPSTEGADLLGVLPPEMPAAQAVEVLRIVLMASPGSPAVASAWALLHLAAHPAPIALSDDGQTVAFVKEVLRLHPPSWLLARHTLSTMDLGRYVVPVGTTILIPVYHVHRDPRWWQTPSEFDSARWHETPAPHAPHAYLPFGAGRNHCPGSHLAMAQLTAFTQTMARGYRLTLPLAKTVVADPRGLLFPARLQGQWDRLPLT
jgi:unspecific monooxygenase